MSELHMLLLLLTVIPVQGACYYRWFQPVDCTENEVCCGFPKSRKCCKKGEEDAYLQLSLGLGLGIPATLATMAAICFLWPRCKRECDMREDRAARAYSPGYITARTLEDITFSHKANHKTTNNNMDMQCHTV